MAQKVRTRMAPSPTGEYHVGHIATLLKNYAWAKHNGGDFILRIEDTDQVRKVDGAVEKILSVIKGYGLDWDEGPEKGGPFGPYVQSERLKIYKAASQLLLDNDKAYYCFATSEELTELRDRQRAEKLPPRYDGRYRDYPKEEALKRVAAGEPYVIRLKVPKNSTVTFTDLLRGEISVESNNVDDQVLMKSDGFPTYHLAVIVDDHAMGITHVLRGEEWISSTPKHVLIYKAFGWEAPIYAHIPVFLNPDGKGKMSKRKGTVSAQSFLDDGYLPEALLNFFMILGWAHPDQKEILSLDEYIKYFDPKDISSKSVVFDVNKLQWINGVYIRNLTETELLDRLKPFIPADCGLDQAKAILPLIKERLVTLSDFEPQTAFFYREITLDQSILVKRADSEIVLGQIKETLQKLESLDTWSEEKIEESVRALQQAKDWKTKQYFMMLRYTVSGSMATPPLFSMISVLGKKLTLERLSAARAIL